MIGDRRRPCSSRSCWSSANTMAQAVRERTSELAVLKTLGFSDGRMLALVLAESLLIAVARRRRSASRSRGPAHLVRGDPTDGLLPPFYLPDARRRSRRRRSSPLLGLATGLVPALQARRLTHRRRAAERTDMISQIIAVTGVNLRSIRQRLGSSAVAVVGIVGVVIVFVGGAVDRRGVPERDAGHRAIETRCMVMRGGGRQRDDERPRRRARAASSRTSPGIARDAAGPLASPELFVIVDHPLKPERNRRQRAAARRRAGARSRCTRTCKIVEGRNVRARHERDHRRPGRVAASSSG